MIYKNNETGEEVRFLGIGTHYPAPNSTGSVLVAIYCPNDDGNNIFVMDQIDFEENHTLLTFVT